MKRIWGKTVVLPVFLVLVILAGSCKSPAASRDDPSLRIRDIYAGVANVFVVKEDGTLWSAGYNRSGQLGLGEFKNPGGENSSGESSQGEFSPGDNSPWVITQIKEGGTGGNDFLGVRSVAAGENHTVILKDDGTLWGAGDSLYGELGTGKPGKLPVFTQLKEPAAETGGRGSPLGQGSGGSAISGVQAVEAGINATFFIRDGSLWAAGYNYYGELGAGDRENRSVFTRIESAGGDVKSVSSGARHTVILKNDGSVWASGYNFNGQLGQGNTEDQTSFTRVEDAGTGVVAAAAGNYHTVILKADGSVWTAGQNYQGQLGFGNRENKLTFTQAPDDQGNPLRDVKEIAARGDLTLVWKNDGTILMAGSYAAPEPPAIGELPPVEDESGGEAKTSFAVVKSDNAASFGEIKKIILGSTSLYVITADGHLWAAGSNRYGQLNLGYDTEVSPVLRSIFP
jgi:alpha-tubulin suppressor-like RCC1 family protein